MSVLIKGMEMPTLCGSCFLRGYCVHRVYMDRSRDCPLVEVKEPHGELVDRTKLLAEYDRQHKGPAGGARKIIETAWTVLEAEGREE